MREYQRQTTTNTRGCHLISLYTTSSTFRGEVVRRDSMMPGSPGHVRCLRPYPPSRRRRLNS